MFTLIKRSFYQDRLGTNIGKTLKKESVLCRNTGLWDVATTEVTGDVVIVNPFVRTVNVSNNLPRGTGDETVASAAVVTAAVTLRNRQSSAVSGRLTFGIEGQASSVSVAVTVPAGGSLDAVWKSSFEPFLP
jgi:hypothetical protein